MSPSACCERTPDKERIARVLDSTRRVPAQKTNEREEAAMWIRLGTFLVKDGQAAALRARYHDRAAPVVRAAPGNRGCALLEPVASGEPFIAMTIWEDRAASDSYEASGKAAEVVGLLREFFAGPPSLKSYESSSAL